MCNVELGFVVVWPTHFVIFDYIFVFNLITKTHIFHGIMNTIRLQSLVYNATKESQTDAILDTILSAGRRKRTFRFLQEIVNFLYDIVYMILFPTLSVIINTLTRIICNLTAKMIAFKYIQYNTMFTFFPLHNIFNCQIIESITKFQRSQK